LAPYESLEGNVVFRYPPDWDIEPRKVHHTLKHTLIRSYLMYS
jgi:hypothetical protein